MTKLQGTATWTWYSDAGGAWYVAFDGRDHPPYLKQRHVEAIIDVDVDGFAAGIEIIDIKMPGPRQTPEKE